MVALSRAYGHDDLHSQGNVPVISELEFYTLQCIVDVLNVNTMRDRQ